MKSPFRWMIDSWVDLAPGHLTRKNAPDLIPADGVNQENHRVFIMNVAHLNNRRDNDDITEGTFYKRMVNLLDHYEF